jgi:ATP synthase protein I
MNSESRRGTVRLVTQYSAGALELGVSVAVGAGIGYWLDQTLGTAPWMTLFWLLAGVMAGFRSLIRVVKRLEKEQARRDDDGDSL